MTAPARQLHPAVAAGLAAFDRDEYGEAAARWDGAAVPGDVERELLAALAALARAGEAARAGDLAAGEAELLRARTALTTLPRRLLGVDVARLRREAEGCDLALAAPPRPRAAEGGRLGPWLRLALLVLLLGGTFAALRWTPAGELVRPERLLALLEAARGHWWMPAVLLLLYAGLCPLGVPATPLLFAGGAIFGIVQGTAWNVLGTLVGAATTYWVARSLGREAVERLGGSRLARAERMLHKHGFFALVGLRFLPIPFPFVNAAAAVAGIRFPVFMASSAVGLAPAVAVWTYFSSALVHAAAEDRARLARELAAAIALLVGLVMVPTAVRLSRRRRRLARFRRARERRLAAERGAE
ncbi:MAG: VTT domain-containing protein [Thermoanaerobaculia bacterium]|nr:VTT domain-containing protein [Thermoanaerobaculia bacterium]